MSFNIKINAIFSIKKIILV